jgi:hypothetical protein
LTDGANLPDGAAIKAYGDANWSGGSGIPPSAFTADSEILVGTGSGTYAAESGATARTSLGLGSASTRDAEDSLTNGSNLPDGAAIIAYGGANWANPAIDDTPVNGETDEPISSNWAYDHENDTDPHSIIDLLKKALQEGLRYLMASL